MRQAAEGRLNARAKDTLLFTRDATSLQPTHDLALKSFFQARGSSPSGPNLSVNRGHGNCLPAASLYNAAASGDEGQQPAEPAEPPGSRDEDGELPLCPGPTPSGAQLRAKARPAGRPCSSSTPGPRRVEGPPGRSKAAPAARAALTSLPATRQPNMAAAAEPPQTLPCSAASMSAGSRKSTRPPRRPSPRSRRVTSGARPGGEGEARMDYNSRGATRGEAGRGAARGGAGHDGRCSSRHCAQGTEGGGRRWRHTAKADVPPSLVGVKTWRDFSEYGRAEAIWRLPYLEIKVSLATEAKGLGPKCLKPNKTGQSDWEQIQSALKNKKSVRKTAWLNALSHTKYLERELPSQNAAVRHQEARVCPRGRRSGAGGSRRRGRRARTAFTYSANWSSVPFQTSA